MADRVMRMADPGPLPAMPVSGALQRACSDCEEELQRKPGNHAGRALRAAPDKSEVDTGPGGGQPLPGEVRAFFEPRFGYDFSRVRLHTDSNTEKVARGLNARAFTIKNDIYFDSGQYNPETFTGRKLLAHELAHTIQQRQSIPHSEKGALNRYFLSPSKVNSIQRKEGVLKPSVTKENPLENLLNGRTDGLTTPFVNGVQITSTDDLDKAIPSKFRYTAGTTANSCKVGSPIDIFSQAKIITASDPGPKGWSASVPLNKVNDVLGITDKSCAAKKGNINVRMVAAIGNTKYAELVRTAEGDHEAVIKSSHDKYLKPYHDAINSQVGTGKDLQDCATKLATDFRQKEESAITNWATDWLESTKKFDSPGGPHTSSAEAKVVGNCSEVLVTVRR